VTAVALRDEIDVELATPAPLGRALPALYREPDLRAGDEDGSFVQRFTTALDAILAPVFCTLDNLPAYFDPKLAPEHFLDWLAGWVGLELYEKWSPELRRTLVAGAVHLHQERGTKLGVERVVAIFAEVEPEQVTIEESGGVWALSRLVTDDGRFPEFPVSPGADSPDSVNGTPWMQVKVELGRERYARDREVERVRQVVRNVATNVKPAHVVLADVVVSA
jgi:phage tail-like protein